MTKTITIDDLLDNKLETATFGMFSTAGSNRVRTLLKRANRAIEAGKDAVEVAKIVRAGMLSIRVRYPEVSDTAVRESIGFYVQKFFASRLQNSFAAQSATEIVSDQMP